MPHFHHLGSPFRLVYPWKCDSPPLFHKLPTNGELEFVMSAEVFHFVCSEPHIGQFHWITPGSCILRRNVFAL